MLRISLVDEQLGICGVCDERTAVSYFDSDLRAQVCVACLGGLIWVERLCGGGLEGVRSIQSDGEAALLRLRPRLRHNALLERIERRAR